MASHAAADNSPSSELKNILNFIDGEFVPSSINRTFENFDPTTGTAFANVHEASEADVDAAVRAAKAAREGEWGKMTISDRVNLLNKVADRINERFHEFLAAERLDTGKPYSLASHIDIPRGAANFKIFADVIKNVPTECFRMETP